MRYAVTFILIVLAQSITAQNFPLLIKRGETKTLTADSQALFILQKVQMLAYQDSVNELDFARRKIELLNTENLLRSEKEQIYIRDTVIYSNLYHHYYNLWDSTDHKLEATEIKLARVQHNKWNLGLSGMLIGVIATLLIVK